MPLAKKTKKKRLKKKSILLTAEKALTVIERLKEISGSNDKQTYLKEVLEQYPSFKDILYKTYSNSIQYHLKKLPEVGEFAEGTKDTYESLLEVQLNPEIEAKDKKILIESGLMYSNEANYTLMQLILDRNLRIGIDAKTINKVIGYSFIKLFQPMKPRGVYSEENLPMYGDFKFNGQRTTVEKEEGKITLYSPSGKIYFIPYIERQFEYLLKDVDNIRLDCELDANPFTIGVPDGEFAGDEIRLVVNGWMNSVYASADRTLTDEDKISKIRFSIFDIINLEEAYQVKQGAKGEQLEERLNKLDKLFQKKDLSKIAPNLFYKRPILLKTHEEVAVFFYLVVRKKGEGLILKPPQSIYHSGESQEWCKLKNIATADLEILDYKLGGDRTKNAGKVTAITLGTSDRKLVVNVGSGLKQEDIDSFDDMAQAVYTGAILEVTFTNSTIKKGVPSLFLPRLTGGYISEHGSFTNFEASLRKDKDVANSYRDVLIAEKAYAKGLISKLERFKIKHGISKVYNIVNEQIEILLKG